MYVDPCSVRKNKPPPSGRSASSCWGAANNSLGSTSVRICLGSGVTFSEEGTVVAGVAGVPPVFFGFFRFNPTLSDAGDASSPANSSAFALRSFAASKAAATTCHRWRLDVRIYGGIDGIGVT